MADDWLGLAPPETERERRISIITSGLVKACTPLWEEIDAKNADMAAARLWVQRAGAVGPRLLPGVLRALDATLDPERPSPCVTCTPPFRETEGMVCQTCGTDYGATT